MSKRESTFPDEVRFEDSLILLPFLKKSLGNISGVVGAVQYLRKNIQRAGKSEGQACPDRQGGQRGWRLGGKRWQGGARTELTVPISSTAQHLDLVLGEMAYHGRVLSRRGT